MGITCSSNSSGNSGWTWYYYYPKKSACNSFNVVASNISSEFNLECDGDYRQNMHVDMKKHKL